MVSFKIGSFFIITTLIIQKIKVQGEMFLPPASDKEQPLKTTEKRLDNFRSSVESFDPNFWPARGRRTRPDNDKTIPYQNCDENFVYDKMGLHCQDGLVDDQMENQKAKMFDVENRERYEQMVLREENLKSRADMAENCYELLKKPMDSKMLEECLEKLKLKISDVLEAIILQSTGRLSSRRHKKLRYYNIPSEFLWLGGDVLWRPESSYGEKEKKQDVFWVARGKKSFK